MKICKDGRIWGQNNKQAGSHLGILRRKVYIKRGWPFHSEIHSEAVRGNKNPFYGRHHTIETKRKMSEIKRGCKNPCWAGGVNADAYKFRHCIEFRLWREAVFARDNWACQECGNRGGRLHPYHIQSFSGYPELRYAIDNGKTLCLKCHRVTPNFSGRSRRNVRME